MLPSLLYKDCTHKKTISSPVAGNMKDLLKDLGLEVVLDAMAGDENDQTIWEAASRVLFKKPFIDEENIHYRQEIVRDAIKHGDVFLSLYTSLKTGLLAYEDARTKSQPGYSRFVSYPGRIKSASELMDLLFTLATKLGNIFKQIDGSAAASGLKNYVQAFGSFYSQQFIRSALSECKNIKRLTKDSCVNFGVRIGQGFKGTGYVLRSVNQGKKIKPKRGYLMLDTISAQLKAEELRDAALAKILRIANEVISQTAADFKALLFEWSFYQGCINLHKRAMALHLPFCFPTVCDETADELNFTELADISLALRHNISPVTNNLCMDGIRQTIVTGANQGGKTTFLRSIGCAQLMAQCGMFCAANMYKFSIRPRIFTHFCKPEDVSLDSGKLDEELARISRIVDSVATGSLLLMNESFSSTTEREGAAVAREIIGAFDDIGVKIIFITHLYEYAHTLGNKGRDDVLLLRAQRREDGSRPFIIQVGLTIPTSHGMDLFNELMA